jgi:hypothetical protein
MGRKYYSSLSFSISLFFLSPSLPPHPYCMKYESIYLLFVDSLFLKSTLSIFINVFVPWSKQSNSSDMCILLPTLYVAKDTHLYLDGEDEGWVKTDMIHHMESRVHDGSGWQVP